MSTTITMTGRVLRIRSNDPIPQPPREYVYFPQSSQMKYLFSRDSTSQVLYVSSHFRVNEPRFGRPMLQPHYSNKLFLSVEKESENRSSVPLYPHPAERAEKKKKTNSRYEEVSHSLSLSLCIRISVRTYSR